MRRNRALTTGVAAGLVVLVSAAPAQAAVLSRADAEAADVRLAGQGGGTGPVQATFDGDRERVEGTETPAVPTGGFLDLGVLTQQATAGNGFSAACAGVAGQGGGIVQLGDGSCLVPGATLDGSLTDLNLERLLGEVQAPADLPLPAEPADLLEGLDGGAGQLDSIIATAVGSLDEQIGPLGLTLRLDAVEGRCDVQGGAASGSASLENAALTIQGGGETIDVIDLPTNPAPNTRVVTDLSSVVELVLGGVETQLTQGLNGATGQLATVVAQIRQPLVTAIRDNLEDQLAPLEDNVLRVVLNEQSRPTSDSIRVTALRAEVLPVAREQLSASVADVRIGSVGCGPAGRVAAPAVDEPEAAPAPPARPRARPELPTRVSAGVGTPEDGGPGAASLATLVVGAAAAGTAGVVALRRRRFLDG